MDKAHTIKGPSESGATKSSKSSSLAKYNLRTKSIQNRIEVERRTSAPRHPKPKQKPAPLSKYRRRTANFRERCRMQEMNEAFKRLESAVPDVFSPDDDAASAASVKGTKITTLKLAVNYISALTQLLNGQSEGVSLPRRSAANNENLHNAGKSDSNSAKSQYPIPLHSLGTSTHLPDVSHHKDLSANSDQQAASSLSKVPSQIDFTAKSTTSAIVEHSDEPTKAGYMCHLSDKMMTKVSPYKVICDRATGAISTIPDLDLCVETDLHAQMPNCNNVFSGTVDPSDPFDLNSFSLSHDTSNLLDDFSALIGDLSGDNFGLVDELIE